MTTRLARALLALALPLVAVPALSTPAHAAPKGPAVPTVEQVAKIYPQFKGGTAEVETSKVPSLGKNCADGKPYAGSLGSVATYEPPESESADDFLAVPIVTAGALSFRSVRDASDFYDDFVTSFDSCVNDGLDEELEEGVKITTKKIRFGLGDERSGTTTLAKFFGLTMSTHVLVVREGKHVVLAMVFAASKTPAAKALRLTKLAFRTAG